ncbi:MAG: molybdopterin molybdotransferase MoeA [Pseudomonadota bacterium]
MSALLSLEDAQARLLALAPTTHSSDLGISPANAIRFLARDHHAARTQPAADLSAMDGYAICGEGPWQRVGESRAGAPFAGSLKPGQCVRISTGAHMPQGSERVLIQENAIIENAVISAHDIPPAGRHVRKQGFDFARGDRILKKGDRFSPAALALAASAGLDNLHVVEPPSVAVLDSGDELVPPGKALGPHQIPASNGIMLGSMLRPYVGLVDMLGPVRDDMDALGAALERARDKHILITTGGASVGDHDLMKDALTAWGAQIDFWKVAIKPGKPLLVATREDDRGTQVILGLPGNPVSAYVTCFLFALPLIRAAMGDPAPLPRPCLISAGEDLPAVGPRREFLRAVSDGSSVRPVASQDSSALRALASANCLIDRPAGSEKCTAGTQVPVYNLQNG